MTPLQATVIDFEGFADQTVITSQYSGSGVLFYGSTVLKPGQGIILASGLSLNEFEFPPHSGQNVLMDDGGPISGEFATPMTSLDAYFTYASPLTLTVFDSTGNALISTTSSLSENYVSSGNAPNERIGVSLPSGFSRFQITGDAAGGSFVMDDLQFAALTAVPDSSVTGAFFLLSMSMLIVGSVSLRR